MTKFDEYSARAAESLAAFEAAGNERDRAYHHRAHAVWRRLIAGIAEAEERALLAPEPHSKSAKTMATSSRLTR